MNVNSYAGSGDATSEQGIWHHAGSRKTHLSLPGTLVFIGLCSGQERRRREADEAERRRLEEEVPARVLRV